MTSIKTTTLFAGACAFGVFALVSSASAHAFLERAVPGVGSTVSSGPAELRLSFTQGVESPLSGVTIAAAGGGGVPASKPTADSSDRAVLHVRLGRALTPGTYVVKWHVVSVDTHPTSGSYKFTVAP
jgi:methionine-rich copper-binding protein CopC